MFKNKNKRPQKLVTIVGPPNSGKTTIFNYLSGQNYRTANYPGATVEYSDSDFLNSYGIDAKLVDSPGIVSLSPSSPDESVSVSALIKHPKYGKPDLIIITIDASQLSRHLFLVEQILEYGFQLIVVLTMSDLLNNKGFDISPSRLKSEIKYDVIKVDGRKGTGIEELVESIKINLERNFDNISKNIENKIFSESDLINIFSRTEKIEKNVIIPLSDAQLENANLSFDILNNIESRNKPDLRTIKLDKILLHKYWGILIFFSLMALTFTSIFWLATPIMGLVDSLFSFLSNETILLLGNNWFSDFISNGLLTGSGAVLVFLPQILILFFIIGILEDTGYLSRGAMLIDKPLSKIGLNGRSFVPMLSGFACAIPAIMASRTIQNKKERLLTIFIIPLLSCSARLPVYSLLVGFLFPHQAFASGLVLLAIYVFSIASTLIVSGIMSRLKPLIFRFQDNTSFIMELPAFRTPKLKFVIKNTVDNANQYLKKAGPIILAFSAILWVLTYFPDNTVKNNDNQNISSERISNSYAGKIGKTFEPVMKPLGMDWRIGVSLIATFSAREVFVSSLALVLKVTDEKENLQTSIINAMREAKIEGTDKNLFTTSSAIGLIVFFVFALQCISTIAVTKKETGGWMIPIIQILVFTSTAYLFTFITVNGLRLMGIQ